MGEFSVKIINIMLSKCNVKMVMTWNLSTLSIAKEMSVFVISTLANTMSHKRKVNFHSRKLQFTSLSLSRKSPRMKSSTTTRTTTTNGNKSEYCINGKLNQNIDNLGFHSRTFTIPNSKETFNLMHKDRCNDKSLNIKIAC